jgi:Ca2+/H+ antiporter, TMEM165/GDT1 family
VGARVGTVMDLFSTASGTTSLVVMLLTVFGASAVEMVEALTIVVAVGVTQGWRCALQGAGAAVALLAVIVAVGGVPLVRYAPIDALRVAVGALLLLLGLSWLRKAVLRAGRVIEQRDEDAIYAATVKTLSGVDGNSAVDGHTARDGYSEGLGVAFKGVLLEGVEVVLIVISLGASQHRLGAASAAAAAAAVVVACAGVLVVRQLTAVPENLLKLVVGVMLTSFGTFWIGEGAGAHWPASDGSLPVLVAFFAALTGALIFWIRRSVAAVGGGRPETPRRVA